MVVKINSCKAVDYEVCKVVIPAANLPLPLRQEAHAPMLAVPQHFWTPEQLFAPLPRLSRK